MVHSCLPVRWCLLCPFFFSLSSPGGAASLPRSFSCAPTSSSHFISKNYILLLKTLLIRRNTLKSNNLFFFQKKKTKTKKRLEKKTGRQLSHMVTDELDCISNTPTCQKALKCRHCGGCITEGYVLNVHPDVKFHPNCLKCW